MHKSVTLLATFLVAFFLLFGCLGQTDNATISELAQIKQTYNVTESYYPNPQIMSAYISEVSLLQSKSNTPLVKFELYSAQSFFYLIKSNAFYNDFDYQTESCKSITLVNAYKFALLSNQSAEKAINEGNSLSEQDRQNSRLMQMENVKEYLRMSKEIVDSLENKCGKIV